MRPDEWKKGMENEAASVEDGEWAEDARRTAWQMGVRPFGLSVLVALLMLEGLALGMVGYQAAVRLSFLSVSLEGLNGLVTSLLALGMAYLLGRAKFSPFAVAVAAGFFPVLTWGTATLLGVPAEGVMGDSVVTEGLTLLARVGLGYFGAHLGLEATRRNRGPRHAAS